MPQERQGHRNHSMAAASCGLRWAIAYDERNVLLAKGAFWYFVPVIVLVGDKWGDKKLDVPEIEPPECTSNRNCIVFNMLDADDPLALVSGDQCEQDSAEAAATFEDCSLSLPRVRRYGRKQFFLGRPVLVSPVHA